MRANFPRCTFSLSVSHQLHSAGQLALPGVLCQHGRCRGRAVQKVEGDNAQLHLGPDPVQGLGLSSQGAVQSHPQGDSSFIIPYHECRMKQLRIVNNQLWQHDKASIFCYVLRELK